jgi:hypothetical protein
VYNEFRFICGGCNMNYRRSWKVSGMCVLFGVLSLLLSYFADPDINEFYVSLGLIEAPDPAPKILMTVLLVCGSLLCLAGVIILAIFWRCPHCGESFYRFLPDIEYCPYCSEELP